MRNAARFGGGLAISLLLLTSLTTAATQAQAVKGDVQVLICPKPEESYIQVVAPASDTNVNDPALKITGTVQSISQIDIYIDEVYNNSVALALGATTYQTVIQLAEGTHTIRLSATDSCNQATHESSFVVTYIPVAVPATGTQTDTVTAAAAGGTAAVRPDETVDAPAETVSEPPYAIRLLETIGRGLGFGREGISTTDELAEFAQSGSVVVGLGIIAVSVLAASAQSAAGAAAGRFQSAARLVGAHHKLVLALGIGLLVLPFLV